MRTSITRLALEKLLEFGEIPFQAFFPARYPHTRIYRKFFGLDGFSAVTPSTFSAILSRLGRQGLVMQRGKRGSSRWALTKKGVRWLKRNPRREHLIPADDGKMRLVIFDVAEHERKKRDVIRAELLAYNFSQLQKSVWVGYHPLPADFMELLDTLRLTNNVHIFSVHDRGTLDGERASGLFLINKIKRS